MKPISTIEAKFKRSEIKSDFTKLWGDVDPPIKTNVLDDASFLKDEKPILLYHKSQLYWWLLTNQRVLIYDDNRVITHQLNAVKEVRLTNLFNGKITKKDYSELQLYTDNDTLINLTLEKRTWTVIYSLFQFIILD